MLDAVRQHGALRWLVGDWLLENGFYRPISSLSIALDYALYGEAGAGFRLTNWLLMLLTALGLWSLARAYAQLVGNRFAEWLALGAGVALSLQQIGLTSRMEHWSAWWFVAASVTVVWGRAIVDSKPSFNLRRLVQAIRNAILENLNGWAHAYPLLLGAVGAMFWGFDCLLSGEYTRLIVWIPSRTALLGTMFSVWAMYALLQGVRWRRWSWLVLGGMLYLLALGSYEQPIMLVPMVGALAVWQRRAWGIWSMRMFATTALCGALILALRVALLPMELSAYQDQQLRSSLSGPLDSYLTEIFPPAAQWQYWRSVGAHLEVLLVDATGWDYLLGNILFLGVLAAVWCWRGLLGGAWLWHALAFMPMAFLHPFEHYMYLPQCGETLVGVGLVAWGVEQFGAIFKREAHTGLPSERVHSHA